MPLARPRWIALALAAALGATAVPAAAQTIGYNLRTGDVWVDTRLGEINDYGRRYRDPFVDELAGHYGAPRPLIVELLDRRGWAPADVYFACAIAHALRRPCVEIVREYDRDPGQGWGALAKRMGIKPGSPAFHALKRGTVATYDRWGHPVTLDRNTRVDWSRDHRGSDRGPKSHDRGSDRDHGKPAHAGRGHDKGDKGGKGDKGKGHGNGHGNGKGGKD
ncbi:hypothetical protein [Cognatilysobacter bugurensis]|uniref:Uncharacterized protein n=1 Tax=Cognatilysobacter bugurensis TaxID=543356 RepID=A0A918W800_9GAMM|nr:hypothetical protein [Lysobacter bugurensis]GHA83531.1 hypothetical protein GCM10007067_22060 [Lysobacter bugurensis]